MAEHGGDYVGPGRLCLTPLRQWALLRRAPHVIGYVLLVDLAAVVLTALSLQKMEPTPTQWWQFTVLGAYGVSYTELTRRIERARRNFGASPHVNMESVWSFAAVLLLPSGLTAVIIAVVTVQRWLRVRHHVVHQQAFSAAAMILAAHVVATVFGEFGFGPAERTPIYFIGVVLSGLAFQVLESLPVGLAVFLTTAGPGRLRLAAGEPLDNLVEAATIGLGFLLAWTLVDWPIVGLTVLGVTFALHHVVLIRQLRDRACSDPKTGLLNTGGFKERARREIARASRSSEHSTALLLIDLDHFKKINDTHGHVAGDEVLCAIAQTLSVEARTYDLVCRYGGEEFLMLLPDTTTVEAVTAADRIRRRITDLTLPVTSRHRDAVVKRLTASIGVAVHPRHGHALDELLRAADAAMYQAKRAGRNRTTIAQEADQTI
jgi:diguanylate cyclase (GGDEF)-like protein